MPTQEQFDVLNQPIDFTGESPANVDMDLYVPDLYDTKYGVGAGSVAEMEAAKVALLEGDAEQAINTYGQIAHEYRTEGRSETADRIIESVREAEKGKDIDVLRQVLADPNIPDNVKVEASKAWGDSTSERYSVNSLFAAKYGADFDPQTEEQETEHNILLESMKENFAVREEANRAWDRFHAEADPSAAKALGEVSLEVIVPFLSGAKATEAKNALEGGDFKLFSSIMSTVLEGSTRKEVYDKMKLLPAEELLSKQLAIIKALEDSGLDLGSHGIAAFREGVAIQNGDYDRLDKVIDNTLSLLDLTYVGGRLAKLGIKASGRENKAADAALVGAQRQATQLSKINEAIRNRFRPSVDQGSAGQIAADTNQQKWAEMMKAVNADTTDNTARALFGRTRAEVLADSALPRVAGDDGTVARYPSFESPEISSYSKSAERHFLDTLDDPLTAEEKAQAIAATKERVLKSQTLETRVASSDVLTEGDRTFVRGVYGPAGGGSFTDDVEALRQVKEATRHWGLDDSAYEVLQQDGAHYIRKIMRPINTSTRGGRKSPKLKLKDLPIQEVNIGNKGFVVRVKFPETFNLKSIEKFSEMKPSKNWADRHFAGKQNTITRMFLNPSSILHPFVSAKAGSAALRTSLIEQEMTKMFKVVVDDMSKLSPERQIAVAQRIEKAAFEEIDLNPGALIQEGFDAGEIKTMMNFKQSNDAMWKLTNIEYAYAQQAKGNKMFVHGPSGRSLPVRPVQKADDTHVYDPDTNTIKLVKAEDIRAAKANGGGIVRVEGELSVGDEATQYLFNPNSVDSFVRDINLTDKMVPYKSGYYHIKYGDPHFIAKRIKLKDGEEILRRVGTAPDGAAAAKTLEAFRAREPGVSFEIVPEKKTREMGLDWMSDTGTLGRLAFQRQRRGRLESLDDQGVLSNKSTFILNPIDATLESIRSLSSRMGNRTVIETMKKRWIQEYGHLSDVEPNSHKSLFPVSADRIQDRELKGFSDKEIRDAKTMFNYIDTYERGFVNGLDEAVKNALSYAARGIAGKSMDNYLKGSTNRFADMKNLEKMVRWTAEHANPLEAMRMLASMAFLIFNPFKQILVQLSGTMNIIALRPLNTHRTIPASIALLQMVASESHKGWFAAVAKKTGGVKLHSAAQKMAGLSDEQMEDMFRGFMDSGLVSSVHTHNMVSNMMLHFVDSQSGWSKAGGKVASAGRAVAKGVRKTSIAVKEHGFDAGDIGAKLIVYAGEYTNAVKKLGGRKLTGEEKAKVLSVTDELTQSMHRGGEMPWNQNSASIFMQFQSAMYKNLLMMTTSRRLSAKEKATMGISYLAMFGIPIGMIDGMLEEHDLGELAPYSRGVVDIFWNGVADMVFDDQQPLAIQETFSPVGSAVRDIADGKGVGVVKLAMAVANDPDQVYQSTPVARLFVGEEARFPEVIRKLASFTGVWEDPYAVRTNAEGVIKGLADLTAGTSAGFKVALGMATGWKYDRNGQPFIPATAKNLWAELFSIKTDAEVLENLRTGKEIARAKASKEDLETVAKSWMKSVIANGDDPMAIEQQNQYNAIVLDVFKDDYAKARAAMMNHEFMTQGVNSNLAKVMLKQSGAPDSNSTNQAAFIARAKALEESDPGITKRAEEFINAINKINEEAK